MTPKQIVRVGVLGDIHAEDVRLESALELFARSCVDAVLCVGDVVDGHGDVEHTIELLEQEDVLTVAGNHDRWALSGTLRSLPDATRELSSRSRAFLCRLPATVELTTPLGRGLLCHGIGDDDMAELKPEDRGYALQSNTPLQAILHSDLRLMIGGHTHRRMVRRLGTLIVVNAGTLTGDDGGCLVLDLDARAAAFHAFEGTRPGAGVEVALEPSAF